MPPESSFLLLLRRAQTDEILAHLPEFLGLVLAPCCPRRSRLLAVAEVAAAAVLDRLLDAAVDGRLRREARIFINPTSVQHSKLINSEAQGPDSIALIFFGPFFGPFFGRLFEPFLVPF